jgi:hypothetical protein
MQMTLPWSSSLDVGYVGQHSFNVLNAFQSLTAVNINAIDHPNVQAGRGAYCSVPRRDAQRFNVVVYNARQTQLQLVSPTNQTIGTHSSWPMAAHVAPTARTIAPRHRRSLLEPRGTFMSPQLRRRAAFCCPKVQGSSQ